ncbi:MAG: hypothetical protein ABIT38_09115 [Gemmatimonadaceae bacterium]
MDPRDERDIAAVVSLHADMLGTGPIALLGKAFMRDFYYRRLVAGNVVQCHIAHDGETPVGFIAWTTEKELGAAIQRRYPFSFALAIAKSIISSPSRLKVLLSLARFSRVRGPQPTAAASESRQGELISLAVRPEFTTRKYLSQTKRRHSLELLRAAIEGLRDAGIDRFHGYVERKNRAMLFVYQGLGCELLPVEGLPTIRVEGAVADALAALPARATTR